MKPNLLFIKHKNFNARTVDNDLQILRERYIVTLYEVNATKSKSFIVVLIKQFFYLIFNLYKFKIVFIWFADYHSYLPISIFSLFGKKSILCLGGYDAHWIVPDKPKNFKEKIRKFCVMKSIKYATVLMPVSHWLAGFLEGVTNMDKVVVAYCCVNTDAIGFNEPMNEKENLIITVGGGGFLFETKRKKLDFFIEIGNFFHDSFPDYNAKFLLIGHEPDSETYLYLNKFIKSPNIKILPVINNPQELKNYFQIAKVYCQFSEYEAFGIAVIEAMLNKTIPIVYNGGAMPEVAGNTGFVINDYNINKTAGIIKDILDNKYEYLREEARERVLNNFTLEIRKQTLFKYL